MKPKKSRHEMSSEDSEESDVSQKSVSSSGSDSDDSSASERRHKKKRKHADSSDSDSDSEDQRRSKKRKHKKKKKKHDKKKRRDDSVENSISEISSESEGEISNKKKRKHKHKHHKSSSRRARSDSPSVKAYSDDEQEERRLHSVVKERRASSEEAVQPERTYYQKEYRQSGPADDYDSVREREVLRFYRGSSKERRIAAARHQQYEYEKERNTRYSQDKYKQNRERYGQNPHYNNGGTHEEYHRKPKEYDDYKRHQRYEEHHQQTEEYRRPREPPYPPRVNHDGQHRGYNKYNQYEQRGAPRGRNYEDSREFHESRVSRAAPEPDRYQHTREYSDKRERFREDPYPADRAREPRRDPRGRPERPPTHQQRESKSRSPEERERERKPDPRSYREGRGEERRDRSRDERPRDERPRDEERRESRSRPEVKAERSPGAGSQPKGKRSRFTTGDDGKEYSWGKADAKAEGGAPGEKEKPNFGLSGKLTADQNTVNGVVIKYTEPDDAKQPKRRWRFYPFKGDRALPILYIHRQSCFVMGRDKKVVDIHLEHPSVSKQHAALQYRATPFTRPDGTQGRRVRPYIIDLDSANGTFVNNKKVEARRFVELLERDVVKFGFSAREYVLLHENSKDDAQDDDNQEQLVSTEKIKQEKRAKLADREDGE